MPETLVQPPKPQSQAPAPESTKPQEAPKLETKSDDLIKRVAAVQAPEKPKSEPKVSISLEDVKDPQARQMLEAKLAEANAAISKTFGEIGAEKSKYIQEVESLRKQLEASTKRTYTVRDVEELLQRPDFIQSANELQSKIAPQGVAQETWSSWTPEEKQAFQRQQDETRTLKAQLEAMQQSQVLSQVDGELVGEFPDYDPKQINEFYQKAQSNQMSPKDIRRAVYFATNAEKLISRAYELGRQDNKTTIQEKVNGMSSSGLNITPTTMASVERRPGERSSSAFSSHAHKVLDMIKNMPKK